MYLVFTGDVFVGLFIPKPWPQTVDAYFWCFFLLLFWVAEVKGIIAVTLKMIFVEKLSTKHSIQFYRWVLVSQLLLKCRVKPLEDNLYQWSKTGSEICIRQIEAKEFLRLNWKKFSWYEGGKMKEKNRKKKGMRDWESCLFGFNVKLHSLWVYIIVSC